MIQELKPRPELPNEKFSGKRYSQFNALIAELRKRNLPKNLSDSINLIVAELNASSLDEKNFGKLVKKHQMYLLKILEKEAKLVTKNHYRNLWMLLGFTAIGIPVGILYGNLIGNMA